MPEMFNLVPNGSQFAATVRPAFGLVPIAVTPRPGVQILQPQYAVTVTVTASAAAHCQPIASSASHSRRTITFPSQPAATPP